MSDHAGVYVNKVSHCRSLNDFMMGDNMSRKTNYNIGGWGFESCDIRLSVQLRELILVRDIAFELPEN